MAKDAAHQPVQGVVRAAAAIGGGTTDRHRGAHAFIERVAHRGPHVQVDEQVRREHQQHEREALASTYCTVIMPPCARTIDLSR